MDSICVLLQTWPAAKCQRAALRSAGISDLGEEIGLRTESVPNQVGHQHSADVLLLLMSYLWKHSS